MAMERQNYLREKQVARRWGISHRTLERWRHDARGPAHLKIGGRVMYRLEDIEDYEAERRRQCSIPSPHAAFGVTP